MQIITTEKAAELMSGTSKIFRVSFNKRSDGTTRNMVGRTGVRSDGPGGNYDPLAHKLVRVYELVHERVGGQCRNIDSHYRSVPIEGIHELAINGEKFSVVK